MPGEITPRGGGQQKESNCCANFFSADLQLFFSECGGTLRGILPRRPRIPHNKRGFCEISEVCWRNSVTDSREMNGPEDHLWTFLAIQLKLVLSEERCSGPFADRCRPAVRDPTSTFHTSHFVEPHP